MGEIRTYSKRQKWTEEEISVLSAKYAITPRQELAAMFPSRDIRSVECKANWLGLKRDKKPARSADEIRKTKREGMARLRASDPEAARRKRNDYHARNRQKRVEKMRAYYGRRFFWGRAMKLRGEGRATSDDLSRLWKRQRGLCALTGRRLSRDNAHLDHIIARARGGSDRAENLRWLCTEANLARRELSDVEFIKLCSEVMAWIGERIAQVEAIQQKDTLCA